jgi:hypothetical protein
VTVVRKQDVQRTCAICHRTLLMGERAVRFTPGGGDEWVDVCALCTTTADDHGWVKEGSPTTPMVPETRRRRRFGGLGSLLDSRRAEPEARVPEPMYRRLSSEEQAMVEAADLFNESAYRRTIGGIAKSLGQARVSLLSLSGVNPEVVITVAWDISWYQYRVSPESPQHVRLAERGYELEELDPRFSNWNGHLDGDGRVTPDIPRV